MRSNFTLALFRCLAFLFLFFTSAVKSSAQTHTPKTVNINAACGGYYEYLPFDYSTSTNHPVIIYFCGSNTAMGDGSASSLSAVLLQGVPRIIRLGQFPNSFTVNGRTSSFIAISPQFRYKPSPAEVNSFIDYIVNAYPKIDRNRIYVTGFSIGGDVAWKTPIDLNAANRIAALVPVAGYNVPYSDANAQHIAAAKLPVWGIHSDADAVPVAWTVNMINKINSFNPTVRAIISRPTNLTHEQTHEVVYGPDYKPNGLNIYEWCLQFSRSATGSAPVVNAGDDKSITLPTSRVTLNGSATDPDGGTLTYRWTKISGPSNFLIESPNAAVTDVSGLTAGTYQFQLEVSDPGGLSGRDVVNVTVSSAANQLPVANAGSNREITLPQNSVNLSAAGSSDPDGTVVSYQWSKISGPSSFSINNAAISDPVISNLVAGTYVIELAVTDNDGGVGRASVQITVNPAANQPPVANAGPDQTITLPANSVTLSGTGSSDPDGNIVNYEWRQLSGPASSTLTNANASIATASGLIAGVYTFELLVRDNNSAVSRDNVVITVNPQSGGTARRDIKVNIFGGSFPMASEWNNWNVQSNLSFTALKYTDGSTSSVSASLNASNAVADNGASYPVTMCPQEVGRTTSYSTVSRFIILTGLDNQKKYSLEIYSSRAGSGNSTRFIINGTGINVVSSNNYSNKVNFTDITPSGGQIRINIERLNTYNYINGFVLTEQGSGNEGESANLPPVVSAGNDQTIQLPANTVNLNGVASDEDGTIAGYAWTKTSGPAQFNISNAAIANPVLSNLVAGVYVFELTVTDNKGATAKDAVTITVNSAANVPPTANAGGAKTVVLPANSVSLNGSSSSDPDGSIVAYQWQQLSGPSTANLSNATMAVATAGSLIAGQYVFELTVTDNNGAVGKATATITVNAAENVPPVANAGGNKTVTLPANTVSLDGSASSDPDGSIASYLWKQLSGPSTATISNPSSVTTTVGNLVAGQYSFELTVRDNQNAESKASISVTVNPPVLEERIIKVNIFGGANGAGQDWNNWNVQSSLAINNLKYSDGTASVISATINMSNAIADNGAGYPTTMCPTEVGRHTSYSTVSRFVVLTGLDNSKRYELEVYGSRNGTGNSTRYSVGATNINVLTDRNYSNKAVFTNITPTSGQIRLNIERLNTYNYINGFILREVGSAALLTTTAQGVNATSPEMQDPSTSSGMENKLGLYPNPFKDNIEVVFENKKRGSVTVTVFGQNGKPVKQVRYAKDQDVFRNRIQVLDLQPGVYYLRAEIDGWYKAEKIVKM
jgi:poly(3-hydroxybutyrate) depolymerase